MNIGNITKRASKVIYGLAIGNIKAILVYFGFGSTAIYKIIKT